MTPFNIPAELFEPYVPYAPEHLTFLETIGRKSGLEMELIRELQAAYSISLSRTRIWLSKENEIEGFRRIGMMGLGCSGWNEDETPDTIILAVDKNGTFHHWKYDQSTPEVRPFGEILEVMLSGNIQDGHISSGAKDSLWMGYDNTFSINPFSKSGSYLGGKLVSERMRGMKNIFRDIYAERVRRRIRDEGLSAARDYSPENAEAVHLDEHGFDFFQEAVDARFFSFERQARGVIKSRAMRNAGGIRKAVKEALDPEVVRLTWSTASWDGRTLSFLSGQSLKKLEPGEHKISAMTETVEKEDVERIGRWRRQAAEIYPAFVGHMAHDEVMARKIDEGRSFEEDLSRILGVDIPTLKKLQRTGFRKIGRILPGNRVNRAAASLRDGHPTPAGGTVKNWKAFSRVYDRLYDLVFGEHFSSNPDYHLFDEMRTNLFAQHMRSSKGEYDKYLETHHEVLSSNFGDFCRGFARHVLIPLMHEEIPIDHMYDFQRGMVASEITSLLKNELAATCRLKDLGQASKRWHQIYQRIEDRIVVPYEVLGGTPRDWSPLIGMYNEGDLQVREITSTSGLRVRGQLEKHCVGSYTKSITDAADHSTFSLIFEIDRGEERLSTCEIKSERGKDGDYAFHIRQNYRSRNLAASPEGDACARDILSKLKALPIEIIEEYRRKLLVQKKHLEACMADVTPAEDIAQVRFTQEGYMDAALGEYFDLLPKKIRNEGIEALGRRVIDLAYEKRWAELKERNAREQSISECDDAEGAELPF